MRISTIILQAILEHWKSVTSNLQVSPSEYLNNVVCSQNMCKAGTDNLGNARTGLLESRRYYSIEKCERGSY